MNMTFNTAFNKVTNSKYRPAVAVVYGTDRGIPFKRVYKSLRSAMRTVAQFNGYLIRV